MNKVLKKAGRPMSNPVNAKQKYLLLKDRAAAAKAAFDDFEKLCIELDLLKKVEDPNKARPVQAHMRRHFDRVWSCD